MACTRKKKRARLLFPGPGYVSASASFARTSNDSGLRSHVACRQLRSAVSSTKSARYIQQCPLEKQGEGSGQHIQKDYLRADLCFQHIPFCWPCRLDIFLPPSLSASYQASSQCTRCGRGVALGVGRCVEVLGGAGARVVPHCASCVDSCNCV